MKFKTFVCVAAALAFGISLFASSEDPFLPSAPPVAVRPREKLFIQVYTVNKDRPYPASVDAGHAVSVEGIVEEMNALDLCLMRYLHKRGIDFIDAEGSFIHVTPDPNYLYRSHPLRYKYHVFAVQAEPNLDLIDKVLAESGTVPAGTRIRWPLIKSVLK